MRRRRLVSGILLLLLPSLGGVQLKLHLDEAARQPVLESEHGQSCARLHDHRLCNLLRLHGVPSTSQRASAIDAISQAEQRSPNESTLPDRPLDVLQPRAPPPAA